MTPLANANPVPALLVDSSPRSCRLEKFHEEALPHLNQVHKAARALCGDPDLAADLTQDTFLRAFRFFHRFEPGTNCRAWLMTILRNLLYNHYHATRRSKNHLDIEDPLIHGEATLKKEVNDDPEHLVLFPLVGDEMAGALEALPEAFRAVLLLVDLENRTYEEAARALGCPIGTVRSRLSRARALLATQLREHTERSVPEPEDSAASSPRVG